MGLGTYSARLPHDDRWRALDSLQSRMRAWFEQASTSRACALLLKYRRGVLVISQLALAAISNFVAFLLRFDGAPPAAEMARFVQFLPWLLAVRGIVFVPFRVYEGLWKYTSLSDACNLAGAVFASTAACAVLLLREELVGYPRSVLLIDSLLLLLMLLGVRLAKRIAARVGPSTGRRRVLIFGAGDAGAMIVRDMQDDPYGYVPLGFVDDNPAKVGQSIHGVRVLGRRADLPRLLIRHQPDEVLIAMPGSDRRTIRKIVQLLEPFKVPIKTLPGLRDILDGRIDVNQIRDLTVEDLLARPPIDLSLEPVRALIGGRRVLVTGAGGSIGSELARQIAALGPASLVLFERYENTLHDLVHDLARFGSDTVQPVIGDVTDRARVAQVMIRYQPEIVFHAAAHKHVPLMEQNPCEAIKNNVVGTATLARAAVEHGVERFIFISTDKAVNPSSVMGASKRIAEQVLHAMGTHGRTQFTAVRFGNVLGSNGSVLPRFIEQIKAGGPVTVTHPEMRRYFMLIPEAVQLVLHAATLDERGMIYVLEMGDQIKLVDLARHVIRLAGFVPEKEIPITFVGLRPGEKLYEELVGNTEVAEPSPIPKIMRVRATVPGILPTFPPELDYLIQAAVAGDPEAVMRCLREMLPTLAPAAQVPSAPGPEPVADAGAWRIAVARAAVASLLIAAGSVLTPASSAAQTLGGSVPPPEGALHAGPLTLAPAIRLTGVGYDSNANNRSNDDDPQEDWTSTFSPSVDAWLRSPIVQLHARSAYDLFYFRSLTALRAIDSAHEGRLDLFMSRVGLNASARRVDSRQQESLEIDAVARRREEYVRAGAALRLSGKTSIEAFADRATLDYEPDSVYRSTNLAEALNHTTMGTGLSVRYAATPLTTIAVNASRQTTKFASADGRNAEDLRIAPSIEFSPFALISGRAAFGVQSRRFATPGEGNAAFTGTVATADLESTILERTRLSFGVRRELQYSYLEGLADYLQSGFSVGIAQGLGGSWEVAAALSRYRLDYHDAPATTAGPAAFTVPDETVIMPAADIMYRFGRARIGLHVDLRERRSDAPAVSGGFRRLRVGSTFSYGL